MCFEEGGISFALLTTDHKNAKRSKDEMEGRGGVELLPLQEWKNTGELGREERDGRNPGSSVWISFAWGTGD